MFVKNSNQQKHEQKKKQGEEEQNQFRSKENLDEQSNKLDPSLLLHVNMINNSRSIIENQKHYGMTMRHRDVSCQYSAKNKTVTLPLNSTYTPEEQVCEAKIGLKQQKNVIKSKVAPRKGIDCSTEQLKNKIFSITTSSFLLITTITLAGIFCLFVCNRASVLVNAQYSSFGQAQNGNSDNDNSNQKSNNNNVKPKVTRQINNSQHPAGYSVAQPNIITRRNYRSKLINQDPSETQLSAPAVASNKQSQHQQQLHQNSIDRFDSGEQIKPPFLRQPTTLKPLTTNSQQVSSNKAFNLQTAASQESYFSPEEKEQLLKNHENHYEGRNYDQQSSHDSPEREQYEKPSKQRWSQPDGSYDLGNAKSNNLEHHESKLRGQSAGQPATSNADNEDGDYEDEPQDGVADRKRANNVPEIRRPTGSASYHHAHRQYRRPGASAAVAAPSEGDGRDESESSDDYGGANDEAHFSRVPNQQGDRNVLNPSASYNQQSRKAQKKTWSQANPEYENSRHDGSSSSSHGYKNNNNNNNNERPSDEHLGFGPGPNEAYMFDRAESGRPSAENEEEGMDLGPGGDPPESSSANEEGRRFDRRSQHHHPEGSTSNSVAQGGPVKYDKSAIQQGSNLNENSDSDDPDENGEIGEDSAASPSSSSKAESKSRLNPIVYGPRISNVIPKTSASAPAPQSTSSSSSSPPTYSSPISITPSSYRSSIISSHQPFQRSQMHGGSQSQSNNMMTLSSNHQNKASIVPYNPQDNPSHAGKYFIN